MTIYELRTYTFSPGAVPAYLRLAKEVGRPARGDDYGLNHGYWTTESGRLNQVWHLWSYDSFEARATLRTELRKVEAWTEEYVPTVRSLMLRQDVRLLRPVIEPQQPPGRSSVYELGIFRARPGEAPGWIERCTAVAGPDGGGSLIGLWQGEAPQPNEVVHLWAHESFEARNEALDAAHADPAWCAWMAEAMPALAEMCTVLLRPTSFSALR